MTAEWVGLCLPCGLGGDGWDFPVRAGVSAAGERSGGAPGCRIHGAGDRRWRARAHHEARSAK